MADTTGLADLDSTALGLLVVVAGLGGATGTTLAFCSGSGFGLVDLLWRSSTTGAATFLVSFASSFDAFLAGAFAGDTDFLADFFTSFTGATSFNGDSVCTGDKGLAADSGA